MIKCNEHRNVHGKYAKIVQNCRQPPCGAVSWNMKRTQAFTAHRHVSPLAGLWVETLIFFESAKLKQVSPLAGLWVETTKVYSERNVGWVSPLVGLWVETVQLLLACHVLLVSPLVGLWVETSTACIRALNSSVSPLVGLWVETPSLRKWCKSVPGQPPCGAVS